MQLARAWSLLSKIGRGKTPLRVGYYVVMGRLSRLFTTSRRYEFERKYAEGGDFWGYFSRPYEREKYRQTLAVALDHCRSKTSALEVGCSVGAFTLLLAETFEKVLAIDVSQEAVRMAAETLRDAENVEVRRQGLLDLTADGRKFDAIFCAEVLYYLPEAQAGDVCRTVDALLSEHGVFIVVHPTGLESTADYFFGWDGVFDGAFERRSTTTFPEFQRPYTISVWGRRGLRNGTAVSTPRQTPETLGPV